MPAEPLFHGNMVSTQRMIYTPSAFAKASLLHLQEIGQLQAQKPHINRHENLDSLLFFIVTSGKGQLQYNGKLYPLSDGDCVFINCRKPYYHETSNDLWMLQWVHFTGPSLTHVYEKYIERGGQPFFHPKAISEFQAVYKQLYEIAASDDYVRDMQINESLAHLLTMLMQESWHPALQRTGTKKQNLIEVQKYLDVHYSEKITLDELSCQFYINKFYLTRIFKEQFGLSINNYLKQLRITHAKQLLRFTDKSIETISQECGMGALCYFSRMFKEIEGIGPSEYRKMW